MKKTSAALVASAILFATHAVAAPPPLPVPAPTEADKQWRLAPAPQPADNVGTPAKVELGRALFFEPRLSGNGAMSCASCHNPSLGWSDGLKTAVGKGG